MPSFTDAVFGYSPQMVLSESANQVILYSKSGSKFIVFLMLMLLQLLLLPLFLPIELVFSLFFVPIIGGLTYSKNYIFDRVTRTATIKRQIFWIKINKEIAFSEIACINAVTNPMRKGTYIFLKLKNNKKFLLDMTTDIQYINKVIDVINSIRNPTRPLHPTSG